MTEYEDLENRLQKHYKCNITLRELFECYIKGIEKSDGDECKGFRVLTNEDAKEWDNYKKNKGENNNKI